jgi:hypothetical protein
MRAHESLVWGPVSASPARFTLTGGQYMALAVCGSWNGGSATLYIIGPDNVTWLSAITPLTANGGGIVDLPPGQFLWVLRESSMPTFLSRAFRSANKWLRTFFRSESRCSPAVPVGRRISAFPHLSHRLAPPSRERSPRRRA